MSGTSEKTIKKSLFEEDKKTALEAIAQAQFIAFAPYVFQASVIMRDSGILNYIEDARSEGATIDQVQEKVGMSHYAVRVLMEAGLGIGLLYRKNNKYFLAKTGHIFLNNNMTRVNTDFMRDICVDGSVDMKQSLLDGKPRGLKHLGNWETIYQGLFHLPEPAKTSWFAFDHYYSDNVFPEAIPLVFESSPKNILDIGGNTGKWAQMCLEYDKNVQVGIADMPEVINIAKKNIESLGYQDRVSYYPLNILQHDIVLPKNYDVIWMSQFLDCFADEEIIFILDKCHDALADNGRIFINETFWDRQRFDTSAFSLQMTSLYFTTMANGNSQLYDSSLYLEFIEKTGFELIREIDDVGLTHTIFELRKK